jgi:hypothetical protein
MWEILIVKLKRGYLLGDLGVNGWIISRWVLKKCSERVWLQNRDQWQAIVSMEPELQIPWNGNFWISWAAVRFSKRNLIHAAGYMGSCEHSGFVKWQRILQLAESPLASQEGFGTMDLVHWVWKLTFRFHNMWRISWVSNGPSQEGLCPA